MACLLPNISDRDEKTEQIFQIKGDEGDMTFYK